MLDHVSLQGADFEATARFYDTVLATLGGRRLFDFEDAIGYGRGFPTFWVGQHNTGEGLRESHAAFPRATTSRPSATSPASRRSTS